MTAPAPPALGAPLTLLLIRHASTDATGSVLSGSASNPGPALNARGEQEARRLATWLPGWLEQVGGPVRHVTCSPALRAIQTAQALTGQFEAAAGELSAAELSAAELSAAELSAAEPDPAWAELSYGEWEGLTLADVGRRWPAEQAQWFAGAGAPPGGESFTQLTARVRAAHDRLLAERAGQTVAVVTHGGPIRALLAHVLDAGPLAMWRLAIDPASVSVLRSWPDGGHEVTAVNRRA